MSKLRVSGSEWLIVLCAVSLLCSIGALNWLSRPKKLVFTAPAPTTDVTVSIEGAVAYDGTFVLPKGSRLRDLLDLAKPLESADLSNISRSRRLCDGDSLYIGERRLIRIFVDGAVPHPRPYQLPEGSTVGDLLRQIEISDDAVTYSLRKRELLVDHQTVIIPRRKRARKSPVVGKSASLLISRLQVAGVQPSATLLIVRKKEI